MTIHSHLFGDPDVDAHFSDIARVQALLDVEVALAEAEAEAGIIPVSATGAIREAATARRIDLEALARETHGAGNVAIPLIRQLRRAVATIDADAVQHVHAGATSQDILDTALILQLRAAVPVLLAQIARAAEAAAGHAERYRDTPMAGRTWLQHATPITFGLKAAGWLTALERARIAIESSARETFVLQFGGAAGTLAALGAAAPAVAQALAERLGLRLPEMPWHGHRDRLMRFACEVGVGVGTVGKVGRDLALLSQTEVAEAAEAPSSGWGGSSSMPHKRNPVSAAVAISASIRAPGLIASLLAAMPQEHERGLGGWQAEWEALPELMHIAGGAARAIADVLDHLVIDEARMRQNLDATQGLIMAEAMVVALAPHLGRVDARAAVDAACARALAEKRPLADVLAQDARVATLLSAPASRDALAPETYLGQAGVFVDRALAAWKRSHTP